MIKAYLKTAYTILAKNTTYSLLREFKKFILALSHENSDYKLNEKAL